MRAQEFIKESWGPEHYPGVLPVGDYLSPDSEFADPTGKKDPSYLHQEVDELILDGVKPIVVPLNPRHLVATQDWLSNDSGDGPLYDEYAKYPVVYQKNGVLYILDGHHRVTAALKANRTINCYYFSDREYKELKQGVSEAAPPNWAYGMGGIRPPAGGATSQMPGIRPPAGGAESQAIRPPTEDDWMAPHGNEQNEYRLFKSGEKPAVIVRGSMKQTYQPLLDTGEYPFKKINSQGHEDLVIGQPGQEDRVNKIYMLVQTASNRAEGGDFSAYNNSNYHRMLGRLLGYPEDKITAFINHYFRNRQDLAQTIYENDVDKKSSNKKVKEMKNPAHELRQLIEQLDQLQEFAPDSAGGAQSYFTSTENFVNDYRQQKEEEIEELTGDGWDQSEINNLKRDVNNEIYRFMQVQNGFLKGLKPGFDAYQQMDTMMKDQLGCHWIGDNLDLNSDWTKVYGQPWGNDEAC